MATTSARRSGLCKSNHLQSVRRQKWQQNQQGCLDFASPSLTRYGKAKVATTSTRRSGLCKPNHIHTVGRQRWQQHQQGGLDFASPITYNLWKGKGGNNISKDVWTLQAKSLTLCGKAKVATTSASRSALCKPNHLQSVGR